MIKPISILKPGIPPPLVYLAAPYTYDGKSVGFEVQWRVLKINQAAAILFSRGYFVFSPISHTHPIKEALPDEFNGRFSEWKLYDYRMIDCCDVVFVLTLPGWKDSLGVHSEIDYALNHRPLYYMHPNTFIITHTP